RQSRRNAAIAIAKELRTGSKHRSRLLPELPPSQSLAGSRLGPRQQSCSPCWLVSAAYNRRCKLRSLSQRVPRSARCKSLQDTQLQRSRGQDRARALRLVAFGRLALVAFLFDSSARPLCVPTTD